MSNSNISAGFQACTLLLWRLIYDIFWLHISLFITVNMSLYTAGDFSAFTFIMFIHLFFIAQNLDSCPDEHVRIRASKADGPVPKTVQFHLQSKPSCYSLCQEEVRLPCQVTPQWQVTLTRAESKSPEKTPIVCSFVESILILEVLQNIQNLSMELQYCPQLFITSAWSGQGSTQNNCPFLSFPFFFFLAIKPVRES